MRIMRIRSYQRERERSVICVIVWFWVRLIYAMAEPGMYFLGGAYIYIFFCVYMKCKIVIYNTS